MTKFHPEPVEWVRLDVDIKTGAIGVHYKAAQGG